MDKLDFITYKQLTIFGIIMALMPVFPEPHLIEKMKMILNGSLSSALDIFDIFWHTIPFSVMGLKKYFEKKRLKNN